MYATEDIIRALREAREAKGLSQRALGSRAGVPQSHISKIENGGTDIRLSSLIEIARALDLELKLVPRKAVPAVDTVVRSTAPAPTPRNAQADRELRRLTNTATLLKQAYPDVSALNQLQKTLTQLKAFSAIDNNTLKSIRDATAPLREWEKLSEQLKKFADSKKLTNEKIKTHLESTALSASQIQKFREADQLSSERIKELQGAANAVQQLRNSLVHNIGERPSTPLPAYRLDDETEDGNA